MRVNCVKMDKLFCITVKTLKISSFSKRLLDISKLSKEIKVAKFIFSFMAEIMCCGNTDKKYHDYVICLKRKICGMRKYLN